MFLVRKPLLPGSWVLSFAKCKGGEGAKKNLARQCLLTCVCLHMAIQCGLDCEALPTLIAFIRLLACVNPNVPVQKAQRLAFLSSLSRLYDSNRGTSHKNLKTDIMYHSKLSVK